MNERTYTPEEIRAGHENLLKLAAILDTADAEHEAKGEPTYDQVSFQHNCGTPACALGHWRASQGRTPDPYMGRTDYAEERVSKDDFAIVEAEYEDLFGGAGCERAKTAKEAAAYIRSFVKDREEYLVILAEIQEAERKEAEKAS
jgi:hypothetical protein